MSVLALNLVAITLTWLVVFTWKLGFEYNANSFWQLSTYGPIVTALVTQLTLLGVFVLVKSGMSRLAELKFKQLVATCGQEIKDSEVRQIQSRVKAQYAGITKAVLLSILAVIAVDVLNDVSGTLAIFHLI